MTNFSIIHIHIYAHNNHDNENLINIKRNDMIHQPSRQNSWRLDYHYVYGETIPFNFKYSIVTLVLYQNY